MAVGVAKPEVHLSDLQEGLSRPTGLVGRHQQTSDALGREAGFVWHAMSRVARLLMLAPSIGYAPDRRASDLLMLRRAGFSGRQSLLMRTSKSPLC